jgi:hypothetical protein
MVGSEVGEGRYKTKQCEQKQSKQQPQLTMTHRGKRFELQNLMGGVLWRPLRIIVALGVVKLAVQAPNIPLGEETDESLLLELAVAMDKFFLWGEIEG